MLTKYLTVKDFIGWNKTETFVQNLIINHKIKSVLEIGAGANPTINPDFIGKHNLSYTISDIDDGELQKADKVYDKLVVDLSSVECNISKKFDLVFSRMVGEHISNAETFHQNIFKILNEGGLSFHCYSTLYALPFLVNKVLPDRLSDYILAKIAPRDKHQHGKFKVKDFGVIGKREPEAIEVGTALYNNLFKESMMARSEVQASAAGGVAKEDERTIIWDNLPGAPGGSDLP